MLYKTRALSLNSYPQGDSNKVVELYSEEYGKINCIANGIRKTINRFGSVFEPMTLSNVVLYKSRRSGLYTIRAGELLNPYSNFKSSYEWVQVVFDFIGKLRNSVDSNEMDRRFFKDVIFLLDKFNEPGADFKKLHLISHLILLDNSGQLPDWNHCSHCGKKEVKNFVSLEGLLCFNCFPVLNAKGRQLPPDLQKIFSFLGSGLDDGLRALSISDKQYRAGLSILDFLLQSYLLKI